MALKWKRLRELAAYFWESVRKDGLGKTLGKVRGFLKARRKKKKGRFLPSKQELARQREEDLQGPVISVVTALYNTQLPFLEAYLRSVMDQTYGRFELCLADASDEEHPEVGQMVKRWNDGRIRYQKLDNRGISENTNAAAAMATGEYLCFADHDDLLSPNALYEIARAAMAENADFLYSDEALFEKTMEKPRVGHFKPDYSPDYLNSCNYICHLSAVRRTLFMQLGGLRGAFDGAQDHDLILRVCEQTDRICHITKVLYYWRVHQDSTSGGSGAKPYAQQAGAAAVQEHMERLGIAAKVEEGPFGGTYRVRYAVEGEPLVSVLIPNKDHVEDLEKCLSSLYERSVYRRFEVIVIENNSQEEETFRYYEEAQARYPDLQVIFYRGGFNYSAINNFGRKAAKGDYLLLLNNDIEVLTPDFLSDMLGYCQRPEVGIVGAKLLYPDKTVQHAGVIVGLGGYAGHNHKYFEDGKSGYMFRLAVAQDLSAVTGACLLVKSAVYDEVGGLDETFTVAYNDVDFCLRVRAKGYLVVFTPFAKLIHYESKSRGLDTKGKAKQRFLREKESMKARYGTSLLKDPYYNPYLTLDTEDFAENAVLPEA